MTKSRLFLAAACAASFSFCASAANWTVTDRIAYVTSNCELSDQSELEVEGVTITNIQITAGKCLSVAAGNTVTIPCGIRCPDPGTTKVMLGKTGAGKLVIAGPLLSDSSKTRDFDCFGDVEFVDGSSVGSNINLSTGDNSPSTVVRFNTVFPAGDGPANLQTRGKTGFAFDKDNVFANSTGSNPKITLGRASNPAGILDLNGHDQTVARISFFAVSASTDQNIIDYNPFHYFTSDTAATLTVTKYFEGIFNGRLLGGVSFKLDSSSNGTASFSNTFANVSTTTGSLICAAGTINLLEGARFGSLSSIRKEGTGNFVISTSAINATADLYLDGTGKVTLNSDIIVSRAYTNDTNGGWVCLKANEYSATNLTAHLAGTGTLTVLRNDSDSGEMVTYTWTGAANNGTLSDAGNWEGGEAPTLDSATEKLVFPATGTSSCRVDGTITVGGIEIAYPGAFTVQAGADAQILLGDDGISVADTTAQTNTVTLGAPIQLLSGAADMTFSVGDGTAVDFVGGLSAPAISGRHLIIDGGDLKFSGASSGLLIEMVVTNATQIIVTNPSGLGAAGATLYHVPYFTGTRTCTSPWTLSYPFPRSEIRKGLYQNVAGSPFEFSGAVNIVGSAEVADYNEKNYGYDYKGYAAFNIPNDTTFRGGLSCSILSRLQFYIEKNATLSILDSPVVRGADKDYVSTTPSKVNLRFYGDSATNTFVVTDQSLDSVYQGVYVSQCALICAADNCVNGQFRAYVTSRDPSKGDPIWSKFDLNGHNQTFSRIVPEPEIVSTKYPLYPDSYVEVASETPATLTFGTSSTAADMHQIKFTGAVSLRTAAPWAGYIYITNTVSTTTGDLEVTSGLVAFLKDAGWGGGTNVMVSGTGVLRMYEGAKGFAQANGGPSKVLLKLEDGGSLDIPSAGTTVSVEFCETNGVRLARGDYTAATLPDFVTGSGTLHVRRDHPRGLIFSVR